MKGFDRRTPWAGTPLDYRRSSTRSIRARTPGDYLKNIGTFKAIESLGLSYDGIGSCTTDPDYVKWTQGSSSNYSRPVSRSKKKCRQLVPGARHGGRKEGSGLSKGDHPVVGHLCASGSSKLPSMLINCWRV